MKIPTSLLLTAIGLVYGCSMRDSSTDSTGIAAANSLPCRDGSPQQAADFWLRERLKMGVARLSADTLNFKEVDSAQVTDSSRALGTTYGAYFRAVYGKHATRMVPLWFWQQTPTIEAFVVTAPSEMYGSATAVWTYDLSTCSWHRGPMTSDRGGDGGEHYRLDGWLVDLDGDGSKDLIQREKTWGEGDDGKPFLNDRLRAYYWNSQQNYFAETHVPDPSVLERAFNFNHE